MRVEWRTCGWYMWRESRPRNDRFLKSRSASYNARVLARCSSLGTFFFTPKALLVVMVAEAAAAVPPLPPPTTGIFLFYALQHTTWTRSHTPADSTPSLSRSTNSLKTHGCHVTATSPGDVGR